MAMGTTERVALGNEMQAAKTVCADFRAKVKSFVNDLNGTISDLLSSGFQGEAANGFKAFYDKNIVDFFADGGTFDQYIAMYDREGDGLFDGIEKALTGEGGIDSLLRDNNTSLRQSVE